MRKWCFPKDQFSAIWCLGQSDQMFELEIAKFSRKIAQNGGLAV